MKVLILKGDSGYFIIVGDTEDVDRVLEHQANPYLWYDYGYIHGNNMAHEYWLKTPQDVQNWLYKWMYCLKIGNSVIVYQDEKHYETVVAEEADAWDLPEVVRVYLQRDIDQVVANADRIAVLSLLEEMCVTYHDMDMTEIRDQLLHEARLRRWSAHELQLALDRQ